MVTSAIEAAPVRGPLSSRRRLAFMAAAFFAILLVCTAAILALDIYVHLRVQYDAGVNVWGYRGEVLGRKEPGETRTLAIGGSTVFGYGLPWNESWPYYLEQKMTSRRDVRGPVRVVNLGVPTDSARTFVSTLDDYAYLHADIVLLYEGYNDLGLDTNPAKNTMPPARWRSVPTSRPARRRRP